MLTSVALILGVALAQPPQQFDMANDAYKSGDYAAAVRLYEELLNNGIDDPALYFNLGNSHFKNQHVPAAIVNYERALQLDPRFESARENLDTAVRATERKLPRPTPPAWEQSLFFWHYRLSPRIAFVLAGIFWALSWATLAALQWRSRRLLRGAAVVFLAASLGLGTSAWLKAHPPTLAVANESRVPVRYGMSDNDTVRFELYAGDRVRVDEVRDGWVRVETADGQRGWAQSVQLLYTTPVEAPERGKAAP